MNVVTHKLRAHRSIGVTANFLGMREMLRKRYLLAVAVILMSSAPAAADTIIDYTLTGNFGTVTFSLPEFPTPTFFFSGFSFEIDAVSTSIGIDNIGFSSNLIGEGGVGDTFIGLGVFNLTGQQLYAGPEITPQLLPGVFQLHDLSGLPATVVATPVSVPEPASLVLLLASLAGLGVCRRR